MKAPDAQVPRRSRRRWLIAAGVAVFLLPPAAGWWWLTRPDDFGDEVRRIGGRYRDELIDTGTAAFFKAIHRQPLTVFHWIDLEHSRADDAWLAAHREDIARQTNLVLFARNTRISTAGLAALSGLENISVLQLSGTPLDDDAIATIASLPNAVQAYVDRTGISDTALAGLSRSPHLVFLYIDRTQATQIGIAGLATCQNLEGLGIIDADDESVARVAECRRLQHLQLQGDTLRLESLTPLKQLQRLRHLSLFDTRLSDADLNTLRQALPKCAVQQTDYGKIEAIREASWE